MPGSDLVAPADEGAAEAADLDRAISVLKIVAEAGYPLQGEVGIGVVVERPHRFLGVPCGGHLASGVAGPQQSKQPGAARCRRAARRPW